MRRLVVAVALVAGVGQPATAAAAMTIDDYVALAEAAQPVVQCLEAEVSSDVLNRFETATGLIGAGRLGAFRDDVSALLGADKVEALRSGPARDNESEEATALMRLVFETAQGWSADDAPFDRKMEAMALIALGARYMALATTPKCGRDAKFVELLQRAIDAKAATP